MIYRSFSCLISFIILILQMQTHLGFGLAVGLAPLKVSCSIPPDANFCGLSGRWDWTPQIKRILGWIPSFLKNKIANAFTILSKIINTQ
jgi:hypothetical protein